MCVAVAYLVVELVQVMGMLPNLFRGHLVMCIVHQMLAAGAAGKRPGCDLYDSAGLKCCCIPAPTVSGVAVKGGCQLL